MLPLRKVETDFIIAVCLVLPVLHKNRAQWDVVQRRGFPVLMSTATLGFHSKAFGTGSIETSENCEI